MGASWALPVLLVQTDVFPQCLVEMGKRYLTGMKTQHMVDGCGESLTCIVPATTNWYMHTACIHVRHTIRLPTHIPTHSLLCQQNRFTILLLNVLAIPPASVLLCHLNSSYHVRLAYVCQVCNAQLAPHSLFILLLAICTSNHKCCCYRQADGAQGALSVMKLPAGRTTVEQFIQHTMKPLVVEQSQGKE